MLLQGGDVGGCTRPLSGGLKDIPARHGQRRAILGSGSWLAEALSHES